MEDRLQLQKDWTPAQQEQWKVAFETVEDYKNKMSLIHAYTPHKDTRPLYAEDFKIRA